MSAREDREPQLLYHGKWRSESAYRSARAAIIRERIFDAIGRECKECGSSYQLEVNHVYRRDWKPSRLSVYRRSLRYWKELQTGVPLTALCKAHNATYRPKPWPLGTTTPNPPAISEPF